MGPLYNIYFFEVLIIESIHRGNEWVVYKEQGSSRVIHFHRNMHY